MQVTQTALPPWLSLQYKQIGQYMPCAPWGVAVEKNLLFVLDTTGQGLLILNVSDPSNPIFLGNHLNTFGNYFQGIAVLDNIVYLADGPVGLQILDISTPSNSTLIGVYPNGNGGSANGLAVSGDTLYLADHGAGLLILNVSNPSNPTSINNYTNGNIQPNQVAVSGNTVFLVDYNAGLEVLNVSNPRNISSLGYFTNGNNGHPLTIAVSNNTVYLGYNSAGLLILDASIPSNPTLLSQYPNRVGGTVSSIIVSGKVLFVADHNGGFLILDVKNPRNPVLLNGYPYDKNGMAVVSGVAVSGNTMFLAAGSMGLLIFDTRQATLIGTPRPSDANTQLNIIVNAYNASGILTNSSLILFVDQPSSYVVPILLDQSLFPNRSLSIALQSNILFTNPNDDFLKLSIVSTNGNAVPSWITSALSVQELSTYSINNGASQNVAVSGNTLFLADESAGLLIFDVSVPNNPILLSNYPNRSGGKVLDVTLSYNTLFVTDRLGLLIFDVSTPRNPVLLSNYPSNIHGQSWNVAVSNNIAFVADENAGLQILNVTNPSNPTLLSNFPNSKNGAAYGVAVSGNMLFVAEGMAGLQILDVSTPSNPVLLGGYNGIYGNYYGIAVSGNTLFLGGSVLLTLDVRNPSDPTLLCNYLIAGTPTVLGNTLFVAEGIEGLQILDVSMPCNPIVISNYTKGLGQTQGIAVSGNTMFVADDEGGLQIIDLSHWELTVTMPDISVAGNYPLQIMATDKFGGTALSSSFTIRAEGPPIINGTIPIQYAKVNQAFNYFVPQGMFTDPNLDPISFSSRLSDNTPLPSWVSFNAFSATFAGTPKGTDTGNFSVMIFATDNIYPGAVSTSFNLIVNNVPIMATPIQPPLLRSGRPVNFTVPQGTFYDPDQGSWGILSYSATQSNGKPLPLWIQFDPNIQIFTGSPPNVTEVEYLSLVVTAQNIFNDSALAPLTFTVSPNVPPWVVQPIPNQEATVNTAFLFPVPVNTFNAFSGDTLFYNTSLVGGGTLPSWLSFDESSQTFSGTPGRSDTDSFSPRTLTIAVYAYNCPFVYNSYATAIFTIAVSGTSWSQLALNYASPFISILTAGFAIYQGRAYIQNQWKKERYQEEDKTLVSGCDFTIPLKKGQNYFKLEDIGAVELKLNKRDQDYWCESRMCCAYFKFLQDSTKSMPQGGNLPHWVRYEYENIDPETKEKREYFAVLKGTVPPIPELGLKLNLRVMDKDGVIILEKGIIITRNDAPLMSPPLHSIAASGSGVSVVESKKDDIELKRIGDSVGDASSSAAASPVLPPKNDISNSQSRLLCFSRCCPSRGQLASHSVPLLPHTDVTSDKRATAVRV